MEAPARDRLWRSPAYPEPAEGAAAAVASAAVFPSAANSDRILRNQRPARRDVVAPTLTSFRQRVCAGLGGSDRGGTSSGIQRGSRWRWTLGEWKRRWPDSAAPAAT